MSAATTSATANVMKALQLGCLVLLAYAALSLTPPPVSAAADLQPCPNYKQTIADKMTVACSPSPKQPSSIPLAMCPTVGQSSLSARVAPQG